MVISHCLCQEKKGGQGGGGGGGGGGVGGGGGGGGGERRMEDGGSKKGIQVNSLYIWSENSSSKSEAMMQLFQSLFYCFCLRGYIN
jgi:hypothetical protein